MSILEKDLYIDDMESPIESLRNSLKEVKLMQEGKLPEISFQDWFKKIKEDKTNGRL